jgi:hypothetical protein
VRDSFAGVIVTFLGRLDSLPPAVAAEWQKPTRPQQPRQARKPRKAIKSKGSSATRGLPWPRHDRERPQFMQ